MKKFGIRRALSTKSVPRSQDPEFVQEDVDEHGHVITRTKPQRNNSLLRRVFRSKKGRQSHDDLDTIHSGQTHHGPPPMIVTPSVHTSEHGGYSFAGAGNQLMSEPSHHGLQDHRMHEPSIHNPSVRGDGSVHGHTLREGHSRGYPDDYASTAGHSRPVYEHDYGHSEHYPHEHITVHNDSPRQSQHTVHREYPPAPYSTTAGTVIHEIRDDRSASGRSGRSYRTSSHNGKNEVEVNLKPGETQEFEIGPNTQLIVPDDVELEISDGKGGWLPYHESLLRRPPREEVYVISGGSNFIVEDEMGNVLHRSQPRTYSTAPVSVAGSVAGRSTRSRREDGQTVYIDS